jgi:hypothetical protein
LHDVVDADEHARHRRGIPECVLEHHSRDIGCNWRMTRISRILTVTLGLTLTGAVVGAVLGGFTLLGWVAATSVHGVPFPAALLFGFGALYGAAIGAVIAPIASWTLLRRVPLGRAIGGAALGTAIGALVGGSLAAVGPLVGGIAGFVAGVLYLRVIVAPRLARHRASKELAGDVNPRLHTGE